MNSCVIIFTVKGFDVLLAVNYWIKYGSQPTLLEDYMIMIHVRADRWNMLYKTLTVYTLNTGTICPKF